MKLAHDDFENMFFLTPDTVNVLIIESERAFYGYCNELYCQLSGEPGRFRLSHDDAEIPLAKSAVMFTDLLKFEVGDKKSTAKLYQQLQEAAENKYADDIVRLRFEIFGLLDKLDAESSCGISYDENTDLINILKAFGVKIAYDGNNLSEKLVTCLHALSGLLSIRCFFFVNLKTMLLPEGLSLLYREAELCGWNLFLFENSERPKLRGEKIRIIDRDLCEIVV